MLEIGIGILVWVFLGMTAVLIPLKSTRLDAAVIAWSRQVAEYSLRKTAKRYRTTPEEMRRRFGQTRRMSDNGHRWAAYGALITTGPIAFLWLLALGSHPSPQSSGRPTDRDA